MIEPFIIIESDIYTPSPITQFYPIKDWVTLEFEPILALSTMLLFSILIIAIRII